MAKKSIEDTNDNIELVKNLYFNNRMTYTQVAKELGIGADALRHFMVRNNIPRRTTGETKLLKFSKEELDNIINLYINEKLSIPEIHKIYNNVDKQTIANYLHRNNIKIDYNRISKTEQLRRESLIKLDIEDNILIYLYCNQNLTATDISKIYNVSHQTILRHLKLLNISIKSLSDLLEDDNFREIHINRMINGIIEESDKKRKQTCIDRYGVDNPFKSNYFQEKATQTRYKNGSVNTSIQQIYLCNLLNGKLNYPVSKVHLDIAYPKEMVYLEYDGGFHDGCVQLGDITESEFNKKENRRRFMLRDKGWKEIRIISKKDKLPFDSKLIELMIFAKTYLNSGHHYIIFDIDNSIVKSSQFKVNYDFGNLRRIRKNNNEIINPKLLIN